MADKNSVTKLDTLHFDSTIDDYSKFVTQFENIVADVGTIINEVTSKSNWAGQGRDAFNKDAEMVRCNLKDLSEIMYDIRRALKEAGAKYGETDNALSKNFES